MPFPPDVIAFLSAFPAPAEQAVEVGEFYECHDILLAHSPLANAWETAKAQIALYNNDDDLSATSTITRQCLAVEEFGENQCWPAVFLIAMVWGFGKGARGNGAKDGPTKLFVSTQTGCSEDKINEVAEMVLGQDMAGAFDSFCNRPDAEGNGALQLRWIAKSFGTKFLFALGMHLPANAIRPLVFDDRIKDSLAALRAHFPDQLNAENFPWFEVGNGAEYEAYCTCIHETAAAMNEVEGAIFQRWDAYKVEQLLFEHAANIGQAPVANIAPAQPVNMAQQGNIVAAHFQNFYARDNIEHSFAQHNGIALAPNQHVPHDTAVTFIVGEEQHACSWNGWGSIGGDQYPNDWFEDLGVGFPITFAFDLELNAVVVQAGH